MPKKEQVFHVTGEPRTAAVDYVTDGGKRGLIVERWLDAGNPSGTKTEHCSIVRDLLTVS